MSLDTTKSIRAVTYNGVNIPLEQTGADPVINPLSVTANGTYTAPSGVDGYSPVTVNVPQGITPSGKKLITDTSETDVAAFATAQVSSDTLLAENIKKNVNILGVVGSFEGGGGTEITDGIVVKARDANGYATEVDYYGDTVYPWTFGAGNENGANTTNFSMRHIKTVNLKNTVTKLKNYAFAGTTELTTVNGMDWDAITEAGTTPFKFSSNLHFDVILNTSLSISFSDCGITSIVANEWAQIPNRGIYNCNSLVTATFPKATGVGQYTAQQFRGCTALQTVVIGGVGYGVIRYPDDDLFVGCTQAGLTITIYTNATYVDRALTKSRAGAANATIIIKASEATTYNGVSYAAGETMITSEVA